MIEIRDWGSLVPQGRYFEPPGLHCERPGPPRLCFEPLKLLNFDFNENADPDPDLAFTSNADADEDLCGSGSAILPEIDMN